MNRILSLLCVCVCVCVCVLTYCSGTFLSMVVETAYPGAITFRHRASCILGQAFHYSPENASYIFNQQIYLII